MRIACPCGDKSRAKESDPRIMSESRIRNSPLRSKIMSADEAAALISAGTTSACAVSPAPAIRRPCRWRWPPAWRPQHARGRDISGSACGRAPRPRPSSTARSPRSTASRLRLPYQSDPTCRKRINAGEMEYIDIHLSHVAQFVWFGFFGKLDVAVVEVAGVREDGRLIPRRRSATTRPGSTSADRMILEVNTWQNLALEGMHDIYYGTALPPHRKPIPLVDRARPHRRDVLALRPRKRSSPSSRPTRPTAIRPSRRPRRIARDRRAHPRIPRRTK